MDYNKGSQIHSNDDNKYLKENIREMVSTKSSKFKFLFILLILFYFIFLYSFFSTSNTFILFIYFQKLIIIF